MAKKKTEAIQPIGAGAIAVQINGEEIHVPKDRAQNNELNALMIAQGRNMIQRALKQYKDMDETPSPRDLKDIIQAMNGLVEGSNIIYAGDPLLEKTEGEKHAETPVTDVDFSDLTKPLEPNEPGTKDGIPPPA